jgi:hypothetical protein
MRAKLFLTASVKGCRSTHAFFVARRGLANRRLLPGYERRPVVAVKNDRGGPLRDVRQKLEPALKRCPAPVPLVRARLEQLVVGCRTTRVRRRPTSWGHVRNLPDHPGRPIDLHDDELRHRGEGQNHGPPGRLVDVCPGGP